ncbi:HAD-superfamily hydrolase, subfamily IA, variant 3 [Thermodesulfobium narugense DSM 14796]|uniref:HAD-superfamily hydrolase, subfamily IA, variant 3 n=1 Tax=Thermodesulfobium narugense DSM 14796 TaxID=747365 RepID=M1E7X4_9BACT|nr:HAD-IA family hydrolase [Thermodesulfobium narugense]AEE14813.1 HAD-superfamily hydrolase, subfamily IA, variant 3 [Thermodesulfobium narugense DSM 14796]
MHKKIINNDIENIFLDFDGTIVHKEFDRYFWAEYVPLQYSIKNNLTIEESKERLYYLYNSYKGQLCWSDIDFWSSKLNLDIEKLTQSISDLIKPSKGVYQFFSYAKKNNKRIFILTNAHKKTINIKLKKVNIKKQIDKIITCFDLGYPKEHIDFWKKLKRQIEFDPEKSVFIDDLEENLIQARNIGIKNVWLKVEEDEIKSITSQFFYFDSFENLL